MLRFFVRHVSGIFSLMFFCVINNFLVKTVFKLLFETQPAYFLERFVLLPNRVH